MIVKSRDIYSKLINGKWIILEKNKKYIRELNKVAGLIWELVEHPISIDDLIIAVCKEFNIDQATAKKDVESFVKQYIKDGFIKKVSD